MKIITYYLALLVFIALLAGFLVQSHPQGMTMSTMVSVSLLLVIYGVLLSVVGEGKTVDERELSHRYFSSRMALIGGTSILSIGILYQLFTHHLDYWLLAGLIVINIVRIMSLMYAHYKQ